MNRKLLELRPLVVDGAQRRIDFDLLIVVGEEPAATELTRSFVPPTSPSTRALTAERPRPPSQRRLRREAATHCEPQAAPPLDPLPRLLQRTIIVIAYARRTDPPRAAEQPDQARLPLRSLPRPGPQSPPGGAADEPCRLQHVTAVARELLGGVHHRLASPISSEHRTPNRRFEPAEERCSLGDANKRDANQCVDWPSTTPYARAWRSGSSARLETRR